MWRDDSNFLCITLGFYPKWNVFINLKLMNPHKNHDGENLRKKCIVMSFYPGCWARCCKHCREQMSRLERDPSVAMVIAGRVSPAGYRRCLGLAPTPGPGAAAVVRRLLNAAATMTADVSASTFQHRCFSRVRVWGAAGRRRAPQGSSRLLYVPLENATFSPKRLNEIKAWRFLFPQRDDYTRPDLWPLTSDLVQNALFLFYCYLFLYFSCSSFLFLI